MTEDEKYVREHTNDPRHTLHYRSAGQMDGGADPDERAIYTRDNVCLAKVWGTEAEAWSAAAEFTRTRLEQIRDVEEEIDVLHFVSTVTSMRNLDVFGRILAREQAALADLKRGMVERTGK